MGRLETDKIKGEDYELHWRWLKKLICAAERKTPPEKIFNCCLTAVGNNKELLP